MKHAGPDAPQPEAPIPPRPHFNLTHLEQLEAESIHIFREVAAEFERPVLLHSLGKDSSVMLHLAEKAFHPGGIPFPLLHIDSGWEFAAMYQYREELRRRIPTELIAWTNPEATALGINPFDHGAETHTRITRTEGLKQALAHYRFDAAFGGARRDEEKSRAKERIFSFRNRFHQWDPKNQRPELWSLYNTRVRRGENMRVFPISNWTELDVWQYILRENIELPSLYFAHYREVVRRQDLLVPVTPLTPREPGETAETVLCRFRTVGDITCTAPVESMAATVADIILETALSRVTERGATRLDDQASATAMEQRKRAGYF
jgi:sulfate adenylyltransferase subunit 2